MLVPSTTTAQLDTRFTRLARRQPLLVFFFLAYLFGWIGFLPLVLTNVGLRVIRVDVPVEFIVVGASTPTIAALCTQWLLDRSFRICHMYSSWQRLLLDSVLGLALIIIAFVVLPGIALVRISPRALHWSALLSPAVYGVNWSTFLGGPVNEEPGWRGFALPRLQWRFGPVVGSILLGTLWAGWHLPLFFIHGWVNVPVWAFTLMLVTASVLLTWGTNLSSSSILVPMLMHAAFNVSFRLLGALCQGVPTRRPDLPYYLCAGGAVAIAAILLTHGRLGRSAAIPLVFPVTVDQART
jgi:membrane protease YdiL (CAAX protease family)